MNSPTVGSGEYWVPVPASINGSENVNVPLVMFIIIAFEVGSKDVTVAANSLLFTCVMVCPSVKGWLYWSNKDPVIVI